MDGGGYSVVQDPLKGACLEPITDYDARLVRDPRVLVHPAIWGDR